MVEKSFKKGEVIFREGDFQDTFYKVLSGNVQVYLGYGTMDQKLITTLGAGEYFGEMGVIETKARSATVTAGAEEVVTEEYTSDDLNRFFTDNPNQILTIMEQIGKRIGSLDKDYKDAMDAVRALEAGNEKQSGGILDKILKAVGFYRSNRKLAEKLSAEETIEPQRIPNDPGARLETFNKGTVICKQGSVIRCMYYLHSGEAGVYTGFGTPEELKIATVYTDQMFGEMGLLTGEPRSATVVAEMDNTLVEVFLWDDLLDMFKTNPAKVDSIIRYLSYRLRNLDRNYMKACQKVYELSEAKEA
ncbi:MAG: cyclic nucleotide-binding domain-containing protein [Clostridia bacterium]|nr:cyclic nucleotide-binding domain-containing protein [Clostridia bacterium]